MTLSGTFAHNQGSRTITPPPPTLRPTNKLRSRTDPCLKPSTFGSKGQGVYGQKSCQAYYRHTRQRPEHLQERRHFDQHTKVRQLSQLKSDSQATGWTIMMKEGTTRPCVYNLTQWTKLGWQLNKDQHNTRTSWPSIATPESETETSKLETLS